MRIKKHKVSGKIRVDLGDGNWLPASMRPDPDTGGMQVEVNGVVYPYPQSEPGTDPERISAPAMMPSHASFGAQPAGEQAGMDAEVLRGLGLGTRNVLEGVGSITEPFIVPINTVNGWLGGDPNYFATNAGRALADAAGLPLPENEKERLFSDIQRGASSMAGGYGAGGALKLAGAAPEAAALLQAAPSMQAASGATAGLAGGLAREAGASPGVQMAALLRAARCLPAPSTPLAGRLTRGRYRHSRKPGWNRRAWAQ